MTGYQEIITDPSYRQQLIAFSYPMIGNYGIHYEESESEKIQAAAIIVKEYVAWPSNFNSQATLDEFLAKEKVPGIQGIDTRHLILTLRQEGAQNAGIFPGDRCTPAMLEEVRALPSMEGLDLASQAGTSQVYAFGDQEASKFRLAVFDFGIKTSILSLLAENGFAITVFPARTSFEQVVQQNFDCYFLSNGPGDPAALSYAIELAKQLIAQGKPIFGICLGHQLIALAQGYQRFKLKFGHRGANQPVRQEAPTNQKKVQEGTQEQGLRPVEITSQNHGFAITQLQRSQKMKLTHINLNDKTVEGFCNQEDTLMCVQYHPEASPGPHDSRYLFQSFYQMVDRFYAK